VVGVFVSGSQGIITSTMVRESLPDQTGAFGRGVVAQPGMELAVAAALEVRQSVITGMTDFGLGVLGSDGLVDSCLITDSAADAWGVFGDGVLSMALGTGHPTTVTLRAVRIQNSARAAVSSFGANVQIGASALVCQSIDLNGEQHNERDFVFGDLGGNGCGCPAPDPECAITSAGIAPPSPIGGLE